MTMMIPKRLNLDDDTVVNRKWIESADAISAAAENSKGDVFILFLIQDDLRGVCIQRAVEGVFNLKVIDWLGGRGVRPFIYSSRSFNWNSFVSTGIKIYFFYGRQRKVVADDVIRPLIACVIIVSVRRWNRVYTENTGNNKGIQKERRHRRE